MAIKYTTDINDLVLSYEIEPFIQMNTTKAAKITAKREMAPEFLLAAPFESSEPPPPYDGEYDSGVADVTCLTQSEPL